MKSIIFIVFCLAFNLFGSRVNGQSILFNEMYLEPDTIQSGNLKNFEGYDLGYLMLYKKPKKANEFFISTRSTDVEIFSFQKPNPKGYLTKPHFFRSDVAGQPIIMIADVSELYSYGVHVFLINKDSVTYCGFLGYAADNFNFSSLALYSHFELQGNKIIYTLDDIDYIDHSEEELISGKDLKFEISNNSVQRIVQD